mmetsp:Transcript_2987/g.9347  ORF Transcript_2987/g.9347 Transcript_2987/m.9347 type:complete len:200 (+) Transcript_2987:270-869(+)
MLVLRSLDGVKPARRTLRRAQLAMSRPPTKKKHPIHELQRRPPEAPRPHSLRVSATEADGAAQPRKTAEPTMWSEWAYHQQVGHHCRYYTAASALALGRLLLSCVHLVWLSLVLELCSQRAPLAPLAPPLPLPLALPQSRTRRQTRRQSQSPNRVCEPLAQRLFLLLLRRHCPLLRIRIRLLLDGISPNFAGRIFSLSS